MRLFIADRSQLVRDRIKDLLQDISGLELVGETDDIRNIALEVSGKNPDMIIMNFYDSHGSGVSILQKIKRTSSVLVLIVLTNSLTRKEKNECLLAGADYFLDKVNGLRGLPQIINNCLGVSHP